MSPERGLFDPEPPTDAAPDARPPVFVLTNRHNLLAILGSRLIGPRSLYTKYYADLLELAPGRVPVLAGGCGPEIGELVTSSASAFPVLIELLPDSLERLAVPTLGPSGPAQSPLGDPGGLAWAPAAVLPLDAAARVHFRTEEERREHELREYDNVDATSLPLQVSPQLFEASSLSAAVLKEWLVSLPEPPETDTDAAGREDRRSGGCMLALAAAGRHAVPAGIVAALVRRNVEDAIVLAAGEASRAAVEEAAATFAAPGNRQEWRPPEIAEGLAAGAAGRHEDELERDLRLVRSILRNEEALAAWGLGVRSPLASAVLMALLRPEAGSLVGWSENRPGGEAELVAAAALAGMVSGRRRMSVQFRPSALDAAMARAEAYRLSQDRLRPQPSGPQARVSDASLEVIADGIVLAVLPVSSDVGDLAAVLEGEAYDGAALLERLGRADRLFERFLVTTVTADPASLDLSLTGGGAGIVAAFRGPVSVDRRIDPARLAIAVREGALSSEQVDALRPCVSPPPPRARRRSARGTRTG